MKYRFRCGPEFAVISDGNVYGWSVAGVEFQPLPSGFMMLLRRWGLYASAFVILLIISILYINRRAKITSSQKDNKLKEELVTSIPNLAEDVLADIGREDVRKVICKEIISGKKGQDCVYDYLIFLLGDVEIYTGVCEPVIPQLKGTKWRALLYYLVVNRPRRIHKEKLMDIFWRDSKPKQADQNLRIAIHHINKGLSLPEKNHRFIVASEQCYSINPQYRIFLDVQEFERLVSLGDRMVKDDQIDQAIAYYLMAIRLYTGDFISNIYESWCDLDRVNYRNLYIYILKQIGNYHLDRNQPDKAIGYFKNALKIDEYSEELCIEVMRCYASCGNKRAVEEEYEHLLKILREELNAHPQETTTQIYQSLIS